MPNGTELPDDEFVYRRIPSVWVKADGSIDIAAFLPNKADDDGLSLNRCGTAAEAAATGRSGKQFFAARLSVAALKSKGIKVVGDSPDHALIDGWTYSTRRDQRVKDLAAWMTTACKAE